MKNFDNVESKDLSLVFIKSQLICAQSLEIMVESWLTSIASAPNAGELCETLEEIANIYLNISEKISALRADDTIFVDDSSVILAEPIGLPRKMTL